MQNGLPHEGNVKGADIVALDVQGALIQVVEPLRLEKKNRKIKKCENMKPGSIGSLLTFRTQTVPLEPPWRH